MRSFRDAVLPTVSALLLIPGLARGDTFQQYSLQASLNNGAASGIVTFNETTNLFSGGTVVVDGYTLDFSRSDNDYYTSGIFVDLAGDMFYLNIPRITSTYTGGFICSYSIPFCDVPRIGSQNSMLYIALPGGFRSSDTVGSGALTALQNVAATPEPSSIALLFTGLLGLGSVARRRLQRGA